MMSDKTTRLLSRQRSDFAACGRLKVYPDGSAELMAASRAIFGTAGWEDSSKDNKPSSPGTRGKNGEQPDAADVERARRRAAATVRDLCRCNRMAYFVTLTLSPEQIDRYDIAAVLRKMRSWLDNRVRRNGLVYILIPEHHKDGAIHWHGFFNDADVGMVDSGTVKPATGGRPKRPRSAKQRQAWLDAGGQIVYNIADWSLGFSTAIPLYGDYDAAIAYTCKYIAKGGCKIGGRWYYSGGKLLRPEVRPVDCTFDELQAAGGYCFDVPAANLQLAIIRTEAGSYHYGTNGGGLSGRG